MKEDKKERMQKGRMARNESKSLDHQWGTCPSHSEAQGENSTRNTSHQYPTVISNYATQGGRRRLLSFIVLYREEDKYWEKFISTKKPRNVVWGRR